MPTVFPKNIFGTAPTGTPVSILGGSGSETDVHAWHVCYTLRTAQTRHKIRLMALSHWRTIKSIAAYLRRAGCHHLDVGVGEIHHHSHIREHCACRDGF